MFPKTNRISLRFCRFSIKAIEKKMVSSTNYKWDTRVLSMATRNPSKRTLSFALTIILLSTSTAIVKRNRERGSPCLSPLDALTLPLSFSFTKTTRLLEDKEPLIQDLYIVLNPFLSMTWSRKPQSTSYAFSKSILRATHPLLILSSYPPIHWQSELHPKFVCPQQKLVGRCIWFHGGLFEYVVIRL